MAEWFGDYFGESFPNSADWELEEIPDQILARLGVPVTTSIAADIAASPNVHADALFNRSDGVEENLTLRQALRLISSVLLGKSADGNKTFRDVNDQLDRVEFTIDGSGNRTAVALDASDAP
jgi:hypothetical protein